MLETQRQKYITALTITLLAVIIALLANYFGHPLVKAIHAGGYLPAKFKLQDYLEVFDLVSGTFTIGFIILGLSLIAAIPAVRYLERLPLEENRQYLVVFCVTAFTLSAILAYFVLQQFPNSGDEYSYVFGAMTFNEGRLWNPTHPAQELFYFIHVIQNEGKWVTRFPPGWPIMLSIGNNIGIPFWLVNSVLGALVVWVFYLLAQRIHGNRIAVVAAASLIGSSFFIFNGASFFSHMGALLMTLLFYYHGLVFLDTGRWKYALLAGIWIGFAFITRPFTAVLVSLPLLVYTFLVYPRRLPVGVMWIIIGSTPFAAFLLYYNYQITGDPFLMVTQWVHKNEGLGFVRGHSWGKALWNTFRHLLDLVLWASPMLLLLVVVALFNFKTILKRQDRRWLVMYFSIFALLVIGYAFYWHFGGQQYGPRFYFESYPFLLLAVTAWVFGKSDLEEKKVDLFKYIYVVGFIWAILYMPFHMYKENRVIEERMDVYHLVEEKGINNAIVLLRDGTGVIREFPREDLTRNGVSLTGDVLYAKDMGDESYTELKEYFPGKKLYRYERAKSSVHGKLIAIGEKS